MDYKEASKRLGISVGTVYNWMKTGKLQGEKKENGELDISIDSVNEILGQYHHEADMVKFELLIDNYVKEQEEKHIEAIHQFCKDFVELFEAGNPNALAAAEKVAERVKEIHQLQTVKETVSRAAQDEFTGFDKVIEEGEE